MNPEKKEIDAKDVPRLIDQGAYALADALCQRAIAGDHPLAGPCAGWRRQIAGRLGLDRQTPPSAGGHLLIRAWGFGFWSDVDSLLGQLLVAEIAGRTPIVYWGDNSRYGGRPGENAFTYYFTPIGAALDDADWRQPVFPPKWRRDNVTGGEVDKWDGRHSRLSALELLTRREAVVVSDFHTPLAQLKAWIPAWHRLHGATLDAVYLDLAERYLHPAPHLVARAEQTIAELFGERPYIAVHLRGLDKHREEKNLDAGNRICLEEAELLQKAYPQVAVFVLSDDDRLIAEAQARFGATMATSTCRRAAGDTGVHHLARDDERRALGEEVMLDTLIALRAAAFIGIGQSNLPAMVGRLRRWPPGSYCLIGDNMQNRISPELYRR